MYICQCEILVGFNLVVAKVDHQSANLIPAKFSGYMVLNVAVVMVCTPPKLIPHQKFMLCGVDFVFDSFLVMKMVINCCSKGFALITDG